MGSAPGARSAGGSGLRRRGRERERRGATRSDMMTGRKLVDEREGGGGKGGGDSRQTGGWLDRPRLRWPAGGSGTRGSMRAHWRRACAESDTGRVREVRRAAPCGGGTEPIQHAEARSGALCPRQTPALSCHLRPALADVMNARPVSGPPSLVLLTVVLGAPPCGPRPPRAAQARCAVAPPSPTSAARATPPVPTESSFGREGESERHGTFPSSSVAGSGGTGAGVGVCDWTRTRTRRWERGKPRLPRPLRSTWFRAADVWLNSAGSVEVRPVQR